MLWTNKRFGAFNKAKLGKFRFALCFQLFNYFPLLFSSVQLSSDRVFYFDFLGSVNDGQGLSALFSRSFVFSLVSSSLGKGLTMQWLIFYTDISAISVTLCNSGWWPGYGTEGRLGRGCGCPSCGFNSFPFLSSNSQTFV